MYMKTSVIAVLLGLTVACSSAGSPSSEARDMADIDGVSIVAEGNLERQNPGAQTIRTSEQLEAVLQEMGQTDLTRRNAALGGVDFERQVVVAAFLGRRRTGGYSLELTEVERGSEFITIHMRELSPSPDAMVTQALTWPAVLILVDDAPPGVRAFIRN
ncbi:MAG: protease complex subunit PrcB family protein [Spirochaetaceae bacterium]|nr:MAG: protease complex subunit PrcB family protein [Spirochaetaceae bacterium]